MFKVDNPDPNIIARQCDTDEFYRRNGGMRIPASDDFLKKCNSLLTFLRKNPNIDTEVIIRRLHKLADQFSEEMAKDKSVCQKGCAHCCAVNVDVPLLEAIYIGNKLGLKVVDRTQRVRDNYHIKKEYCPFLDQKTASCSIYEYRPLQCRVFSAFDHVKYCENSSTSHAVVGISSSTMSSFYDDLLMMANGANADIREWFADYTDSPYSNSYSKDMVIEYKDRKDV